MGLDGVELLMELEDEFGVSLPDQVVADSRTPRQLIDGIWSILREREMTFPQCQNQRAFYRLRQAIRAVLRIPREQIRLETPIRSLIADKHDVDTWSRLWEALGQPRWPHARHPLWIRLPLILGVLALPYFVVVLLPNVPLSCSIITGLAASLGLVIVAMTLTRPLLQIPGYGGTLRGLVSHVQRPRSVPQSRKGVAETTKRIILEQLGLREDEYWEDADFARELKMG